MLTVSGDETAVVINYSGLTPIWRGVYGPYHVVIGSFPDGGDFEFAIKVQEAEIKIDHARPRTEVYLVD